MFISSSKLTAFKVAMVIFLIITLLDNFFLARARSGWRWGRGRLDTFTPQVFREQWNNGQFFYIDFFRSPTISFDDPYIERNTIGVRICSSAFFIQTLHARTHSCKKVYFNLFDLYSLTCWRYVNSDEMLAKGSRAVDCVVLFFFGFLSMVVSEIMEHFRKMWYMAKFEF